MASIIKKSLLTGVLACLVPMSSAYADSVSSTADELLKNFASGCNEGAQESLKKGEITKDQAEKLKASCQCAVEDEALKTSMTNYAKELQTNTKAEMPAEVNDIAKAAMKKCVSDDESKKDDSKETENKSEDDSDQ